jgi:hypothetical protein
VPIVTVAFGDAERIGSDITAGWIAEQIHARERAGMPICAQVSILGDGVNVVLAAGDCPSGRPSSRRPNQRELEILELWRRWHLGAGPFAPGALEAFVHAVERL